MYKFLDGLTNVVLVRGNHEDLLVDMLIRRHGERHDISNGTVRTAADLADMLDGELTSSVDTYKALLEFITPFLNKYVNYFETKNYIFVHGWIPCDDPNYAGKYWWQNNRKFVYNPDWRTCDEEAWNAARWVNGIDAGFVKKDKALEPGKTIICGHWHCSYGNYWKAVRETIEAGGSIFDTKVGEFNEHAIWEPFEAPGIMAVDRCTAHTGEVNVVVLEDELLEA
jgi:hypothetical protein